MTLPLDHCLPLNRLLAAAKAKTTEDAIEDSGDDDSNGDDVDGVPMASLCVAVHIRVPVCTQMAVESGTFSIFRRQQCLWLRTSHTPSTESCLASRRSKSVWDSTCLRG